MLREHNFLHEATNELIKLMFALLVSREHTSSVRHVLFMEGRDGNWHR